MRFALAFVAAAALALGSLGVRAQQPLIASVVVSGVQSEGSTGVASVTVLDAAGNPIGGLSQGGNFKVQVDGQDAKVTAVSSELDSALPLGVVLLVDTSGSMADGGALEAAKAAINPLVQSLQPNDRAALIIFANGVQTLVDPTSDKDQLALYVRGLQPGGNTALFAAVSRASQVAAGLTEPRKAVVLLSDGQDFGNVSGGVTRAQALAAAQSAGVPFFVVALGNQVDAPFLSDLSKNAGGQLLTAANAQELGALYNRIAERLRVQYTLKFALPELTPGDHEITVTTGSATDEATLTIAGATSSANVALSGLGGELREPTVVTVTNLASSVRVTWRIDGAAASGAGSDTRDIELDPYAFGPNTTHTIAALYDPSDPAKTAEATFTVPPLPPRLISPTELPNLAPLDLVRLEVQVQPGVQATAIYLVDGEEVERDTGEPYEFTLPSNNYDSGDHELAVILEAGGQRAEKKYSFEGAPGESTNYAAYGIIAIAALAVLAIAGYGGRTAFERYHTRQRPVDLSGVAANLEEWARDRRGDDEPGPAAHPAPQPPAPGAWGAFTVIDAPRKADKPGLRWDLKDETELVGRGKFCSVRLKDRTVQEAHFVVTSEGIVHASTPACRLQINGADVRRAKLSDGALIRLGDTTLRFTAAR